MTHAAALDKVKKQFEEEGFVHIPGHRFMQFLIFFGASIDDLYEIEEGEIHDEVSLDREPTMKFRQVCFHRVLLEDKDDEVDLVDSLPAHPRHHRRRSSLMGLISSGMRRFKKSLIAPADCESVTSLSKEEICSDQGAKVFFQRSGARTWSLPPNSYSLSSVPGAYAKLMDFFNPSIHDDQNGTLNGEKI